MNVKLNKSPKLAFVACVAMALLAPAAKADTAAYTIPAPGAPNGDIDTGATGMSGFEFTLSENINLTQLGFTALSLGGDTPHVSLWSVNNTTGALSLIYDTGNILSQVTSTSANNNPPTTVPTAAFSYVSVGTPIALSSGQTYLVTAPAYWAANFPSADVTVTPSVFSATSFVTDGGWNGWANNGYAGFNAADPSAPDQLTGTTGTLTDFTTATSNDITEADFQFTAAAAPEPSTYALLGAGLLLLVGVQRWRLKKA
jgi:hypothetical protein